MILICILMIKLRVNMLDKGQLISEWLLDLFNQKMNKNISVFLPYLSKIGQIKKRRQIIILEDK